MDIISITIKERKEQMSKKQVVLQDSVTNSGIMLSIKDEMYIIRDGKKMRLHAFIINERSN